MKQLLLLALLTFGFINQAQIKYEFGPEGVPAKDLRFNEVLGGSENFFYVHKISTEGKGLTHYIQKVDRKTLLPIDIKEMVLEAKDYTIEVNRLVCYDDELIAFVTKRYKRTREFTLIAVTYDLSSLTKIRETPLEVLDVKPTVSVKVSSDYSKTLIKRYSTYTDFIVYDNAKGVKIYEGKSNESNSPLYKKAIVTYAQSERVDDFEVDNDGNIIYGYKLLNEIQKDNAPKNKLHFLFINTKTNLLKDYLISSDFEFYSWNPMLTCLSDNKVMLSASFLESDPNREVGLKSGVLNYIFDNNKSVILSKKFSQDEGYRKSPTDINNPKKLSKFLEFDETLPYDGGCILLAHKGRNIAEANTNNYLVYYLEIVVIKVNSNAEVVFYEQFPFKAKITHGIGPSHLLKQFIANICNDNLFLFHNEHPETTKLIENNDQESELFEVWDRSDFFVCNKINLKDGVNKRTVIKMPDQNSFNPIPEPKYVWGRPIESSLFNQFNKTLYIPVGWGSKKERFLKVTLD